MSEGMSTGPKKALSLGIDLPRWLSSRKKRASSVTRTPQVQSPLPTSPRGSFESVAIRYDPAQPHAALAPTVSTSTSTRSDLAINFLLPTLPHTPAGEPFLPTAPGTGSEGVALTGYVQITNKVEFDISTTKLVVVILSGKGVVDMTTNMLVDPEEDGHMYHIQLIVKAIQSLWLNEKIIPPGRHSFPFRLLVPADLPPTLHTGRPDRDTKHLLFAALHRPELPRLLIQKKEILVRRCVPRFDSERRMVSGVIGKGYISFQSSIPDPYYMGDSTTINAQASRSVHSTNEAEVTGADFVFKEIVTFRNPDKTSSTNVAVLGPPISTSLSGPQSEMLRVPIPKSLGQPDVDTNDISITHEVWFSIKYRLSPTAPETTTSTTIPIRFAMVADIPQRLTRKPTAMAGPTQPRTLERFPALQINGSDELYAKRDWQPTESDELQMKVGDAMCVWVEFDDGWCYGRNLTSLRVGVFPVSVLTPVLERRVSEASSMGAYERSLFKAHERKSSRVMGVDSERGSQVTESEGRTSGVSVDGKASLLDSGGSWTESVRASPPPPIDVSASAIQRTLSSVSTRSVRTPAADLVNHSARLLRALPPRQDSLEDETESVDALQYRVHTSWAATDDGDLELVEGDLVVIIGDAGKGNAVGFNCRTSQHGVFPFNCIDRTPAPAGSSPPTTSPLHIPTHPIRNQASIQRKIRVHIALSAPTSPSEMPETVSSPATSPTTSPLTSTPTSPTVPAVTGSVAKSESELLEELDAKLKGGSISGAEYIQQRQHIRKSVAQS
ncbi:hypothetical protein HK097_000258 [Rhizophlyctis rosea]|uniref:SH3 domain-containing protein n=1 Tax=Rhizophlyctis rosea TaxID=64517 RepID=A0AAD5SDT3_9FUNG|nr:hypothetical protein HK097_000258 [Rhizophlyctis rosea]